MFLIKYFFTNTFWEFKWSILFVTLFYIFFLNSIFLIYFTMN